MHTLIEVLERIKQRMLDYEAELRKSEALTRYALIDPVLRALGWDLEQPSQVRPEFPTEAGRPDYALMWNEAPQVMIEAKPLGGNLERARDEGFRYCWQNKVPYYVITDGNIWKLYDLREMGGKLIFSANISEEDVGKTARQLLALWYPAMPHIQPAPQSVIQESLTPRLTKTVPTQGITLSKLLRVMKPGQKPPRKLYFPDGKQKNIRKWKDVLIAVAKWSAPYLKNKLPVRPKRGKRVLLDKSRAGMREPRRVNGLWLETNVSSRDCIRFARYLLELAEKPPDGVYVEI